MHTRDPVTALLRRRSSADLRCILTICYAFAAAAALRWGTPNAWAASDGPLGPTSEGTTDVSVSLNDLVRISGIEDLDFMSVDGTSAESLDDDVCIYTNNPTGTYKVTAHGSGAASAFTVSDGNGHTITYTVRFNNATGTSGNFSLDVNSESGQLSGAHTSSTSCGGGNNANFEVSFSQNALLNVPAGTYTGTLTLIIEPA